MHFELMTKTCNCSRLFDGPWSVVPKLGTCISYRSYTILQGDFLSHKNIVFRRLPCITLMNSCQSFKKIVKKTGEIMLTDS